MKTIGVMKWWKCLIEMEFGTDGGDGNGNKIANAWWKAWNEARLIVDQGVRKGFGSAIAL